MENTICQSCGMPMTAVEHFGTNQNKSINHTYCCFCFQNGEYTDNLSFDEFLEDAIGSYHKQDKILEHYLSKDELRLQERIRLMPLKRWKSHHNTHREYYRSVNNVLIYIHENLTNIINLTDLAEVAHMSEFHFHRIFKAIINEGPGEYIQRLRLEKTAFLLQTTKKTLDEIAEQTGYLSRHALSKAFKRRYGLSPSFFKLRPDDLTVPMKSPIEDFHLTPSIININPIPVYCTQVINPYKEKYAFQYAWNKLTKYTETNGIPDENNTYYCISRDISTITHPEKYRVYACINTKNQISRNKKLIKQTIEGGLYAVFTYQGSYLNLDKVYCNIYRYWIPNSNYELRENISFEKYLNSPINTEEKELRTEIYIPINRL